MIFRQRPMSPPAGVHVCVGAKRQISPMHMPMRAVGTGQVSGTVELLGRRRSAFTELYDAGDRRDPCIGERQLHRDPIARHESVGIRVCEPDLPQVLIIKMRQRGVDSQAPRRSGALCIAFKHFADTRDRAPRTRKRIVRTTVGDDDDPIVTQPRRFTAAADALNTRLDARLFVLSGYDNADRPPGMPGRLQLRRHVSRRNPGRRAPLIHAQDFIRVSFKMAWTWSPCSR